MRDNLAGAVQQVRSTVLSFKRKLSQIRLSVDQASIEIDKLDARLETVVFEADTYRNRLKKETENELRLLNQQLLTYKDELDKLNVFNTVTPVDRNAKVASTMSIFEMILFYMCNDADDFRAMCEAFIFPAIYEPLINSDDEAYFLTSVPEATDIVIARGKEYLEFFRSECDQHLTEEQPWFDYHDLVVEWLRNDALPLLYKQQAEDWLLVVPLERAEILDWKENPANRPVRFPEIFDAYDIYKDRKDDVFVASGVRDYEEKLIKERQRV